MSELLAKRVTYLEEQKRKSKETAEAVDDIITRLLPSEFIYLKGIEEELVTTGIRRMELTDFQIRDRHSPTIKEIEELQTRGGEPLRHFNGVLDFEFSKEAVNFVKISRVVATHSFVVDKIAPYLNEKGISIYRDKLAPREKAYVLTIIGDDSDISSD